MMDTDTNSTKKILILFAHPAFQRSRVNRAMLDAVKDIDAVTIRDLYELYPDFHINTKIEQEMLHQNDIIIFQHPLYWFSAPSLLKEWQDLVLIHGWAYGRGATALKDKIFFSTISTGADESFYLDKSKSNLTMKELLAPFAQLAKVCGMLWLPPFVVHSTHSLTQEQMDRNCLDYRNMLSALSESRVDIDAALSLHRLNYNQRQIISTGQEPA